MWNPNKQLWTHSKARCPYCSMCQKATAIHECLGCGKTFCSQDTAGHRQALRGELQELMYRSEQWNSDWAEEIRRRRGVLQADNDNVFKQIEDWEVRSIARIKQAGDEAREDARKVLHHHISRLQNRSLDTTALKVALETDNFLEPNLKIWRRELEHLRSKTSTFIKDYIQVREEEPFISKFVVKGYFPPNEPDHDGLEIRYPPDYLMVPVDDYLDSYYQGKLRPGDHYVRYRDRRPIYGIPPRYENSLRSSSWI